VGLKKTPVHVKDDFNPFKFNKVAEAMVALVLAGAYREKFGGDHIDDVLAAIAAYKQRIDFRG